MVNRPKKFVIVDGSSPAVAQAKSHEQLVPGSFRVKMWTLKWLPKGRAGPHIRLLDVISGHYSISPHMSFLTDERFAVSVIILASWRFLQKSSSLCYLGLQYFLCHDYWISEAAAEPREKLLAAIFNEPADFRGKQVTKNYHELSYAWSNQENYHRLSCAVWPGL